MKYKMQNGKKVIDSKKNLTINVTLEDCGKAKRKIPSECAAAFAIIREHPDVLGATVNRGITLVEYPKHVVRYSTPMSLSFELGVFDRGAKFEPGEHTLYSTHGKSHSLENIKERNKNKPDTRTRHDRNDKQRVRHEISGIRPRANASVR